MAKKTTTENKEQEAPKLQTFYFPEAGRTVEATSIEEATKKLNELLTK